MARSSNSHSRSKGPMYVFTNESLESIVKSLSPSKTDSVLSVGGSGDQAFALAELAGRVVVCDTEPLQVSFIRERIIHLRNGNYQGFYGKFIPWQRKDCPESLIQDSPKGYVKSLLQSENERLQKSFARRNDYFRQNDRIMRIRQNVDNIVVDDPKSIGKYPFTSCPEQFNIIYLSNVLGYYTSHDIETIRQELMYLSRILKQYGLIYVTNFSSLGSESSCVPSSLRIEEHRTEIALSHYKQPNWKPSVLRRVF